ncbi:MAG: hypothetical protein ABR506_10595 [Candidatus Krumholzibacteriia bacterium]
MPAEALVPVPRRDDLGEGCVRRRHAGTAGLFLKGDRQRLEV